MTMEDMNNLPKTKNGKLLFRDEEFLSQKKQHSRLALEAGVNEGCIRRWRKWFGIKRVHGEFVKIERGEGDLLIEQESQTQFQLQKQRDHNSQL